MEIRRFNHVLPFTACPSEGGVKSYEGGGIGAGDSRISLVAEKLPGLILRREPYGRGESKEDHSHWGPATGEQPVSSNQWPLNLWSWDPVKGPRLPG